MFLYAETFNKDFSVEPGLLLGPMGKQVDANYTHHSDLFQNNTLVAAGGDFVGCSSGWDSSNYPSIDYNVYMTPNVSSMPFKTSGCCSDCGTWAGWQKNGFDVHSTRLSKVSLDAIFA